MHLLSCEHPIRVYNKYIEKYIWVPCGKCNTCRNMKALKWTDALERERLQHRYCMFVTLTYSDINLPLLTYDHFREDYSVLQHNRTSFESHNVMLAASRCHDDICIPFESSLFEHELEDEKLFFGLFDQFDGVPYASKSDIQYFNKRLNKWFFNNVTKKFKNFRYFVVSEYGPSTLRPHFHGIYFFDSSDIAKRFKEGVSLSWQKGTIDCQFVEKSACSYVAQYINKSADLPIFYQKGALAPFFLFSRCPTIGCRYISDSLRTDNECTSDLQEIFDNTFVEVVSRRRNTGEFVVLPLDRSTENRLFAKCPFFSQITMSCRVELYTISLRYVAKDFREFLCKIRSVMYEKYCSFSNKTIVHFLSTDILYNMFYLPFSSDDIKEIEKGINWLRRLFYLSRKICINACNFGVDLLTYVNRICDYWNKKELYLLKKFYIFQSEYCESKGLSDDLVFMYPEFIWTKLNTDIPALLKNYTPDDIIQQRETAAFYAFSNKKSHFKNAYLDSLEFKRNYKSLFNTLKIYFYAKKCNEVIETIAA